MYMYILVISNNGMSVNDEFPHLLFVKVKQHGTTNFAIMSTKLGGFKESGFAVNKKWLLKI